MKDSNLTSFFSKRQLVKFGSKVFYLFGAPLTSEDKKAFEKSVLTRFGEKKIEEAVIYVEKVLDRQINKAIGLLTFNSIIVAVGSLANKQSIFDKGSGILALISCLFLISIMYVFWSDSERFKNPKNDFEGFCSNCYWRSIVLSISIILSILATALLLISFLFFNNVTL